MVKNQEFFGKDNFINKKIKLLERKRFSEKNFKSNSIRVSKAGLLGSKKEVEISKTKNDKLKTLLKLITNHSSIEDLFMKLQLNDKFVYDQRLDNSRIRVNM